MITLARMIEAWRDAEIFNHPTDPRGFWWHILKFPQYGLWLTTGLTYPSFILIIIDVLIAWPMFELSLKFFRRRYK